MIRTRPLRDPASFLSALPRARQQIEVRMAMEVELGEVRFDGLGHTWTKVEVDTTALMWQLFKSHRRAR